jgi:hypothetical protein
MGTKEVRSFICDSFDKFIQSKELKQIHESTRSVKYFIDPNDIKTKNHNYSFAKKYSAQQQEAMFEMIHTCLSVGDRNKNEVCGWVFIEGWSQGRYSIVFSLDDECFFVSVPDKFVSSLRQLANYEGRLICSRNEFGDDRNGKVQPIRKYKSPERASERLRVPRNLLLYLDKCQSAVFSENNVIRTSTDDRVLYKGNPMRISIRKGCESFIEAMEVIGREQFLESEKIKSEEGKYMEYEYGTQFYFVGDKVFVELRLGFQCTIFRLPKRLHKDSLKYSYKQNLAINLDDLVKKTQQTM